MFVSFTFSVMACAIVDHLCVTYPTGEVASLHGFAPVFRECIVRASLAAVVV